MWLIHLAILFRHYIVIHYLLILLSLDRWIFIVLSLLIEDFYLLTIHLMNCYYHFSFYQQPDNCLSHDLINRSRFTLFHSPRLPRFFGDYKNYLYLHLSFFRTIFLYIFFHKNNLALSPISYHSYSSQFDSGSDLLSLFTPFCWSCSINSSHQSTTSINFTY